MFEFGFWEMVVVAVVALIVVGPEKLPGLARTAGLWVGKARRIITDIKAEVDRDLQLEELKQSFRQQANLSELNDFSAQMKSFERDIQAEFHDPGPPPGWRPGLPVDAPPPEVVENPVSASAAPSPVQLAKNTEKPRELPSAPPPATTPPSSDPLP